MLYRGRYLCGTHFNSWERLENMPVKRLTVSSVALFVMTVGVVAAAELKSGLQPGDAAGYYLVKDCTGPQRGNSLCYR